MFTLAAGALSSSPRSKIDSRPLESLSFEGAFAGAGAGALATGGFTGAGGGLGVGAEALGAGAGVSTGEPPRTFCTDRQTRAKVN